MATLPTNQIGMRRQPNDANERVCGQCGCLVAVEHVARHIAWHGAAWASPVVTADNSGPA
jgi:hypothetical protein